MLQPSTNGKRRSCASSEEKLQMASANLPPYAEAARNQNISVLLVGKTGSGKSSLGNALLRLNDNDEGAFVTNSTMCSSNVECRKITKCIDNRLITVVDTPGTMDTNSVNRGLYELVRAIIHCPTGFHVILMVLRLDTRFTSEEVMAVKLLENMFGKDMFKFCILVFSRGDSIENDDGLFHTRIHQSSQKIDTLNDMLHKCRNRAALVDNGPTRNASVLTVQIRNLRELMDQVVQNNSGATFSNEYFELARRELIAGEQHLRNNERRKREEFDRQVREAGETERKRLEAELQAEIRAWENGLQEQIAARIEDRVQLDGKSCFPADATVQTPEGRVRMSELCLGQSVLGRDSSGRLVYSPMYTWGHRDPDASPVEWTVVRTVSGAVLTLSSDHLVLLANGGEQRSRSVTVSARKLRSGISALWILTGTTVGQELVTEVRTLTPRAQVGELPRGLFAPFTLSGNLFVDGVLASCYVDCHVPAPLLHGLLWPVRAAWRVWPAAIHAVGCPDGSQDAESGTSGMPSWVRAAAKGLLPRLRRVLPSLQLDG